MSVLSIKSERVQALVQKLVKMPQAQFNQVEDFIDFLLERQRQLAIEEAEDTSAVRDIEARIASGQERVSDWADFQAELNGLPTETH